MLQSYLLSDPLKKLIFNPNPTIHRPASQIAERHILANMDEGSRSRSRAATVSVGRVSSNINQRSAEFLKSRQAALRLTKDGGTPLVSACRETFTLTLTSVNPLIKKHS